MKSERERFHALELPVAQLAAMQANQNRDPKKQRKPYSTLDFCFFVEDTNSGPDDRAARAYMKLVNDETLPDWAVFCAGDFISGDGKPFHTDPALIGDGFMLLAPQEIEGGFTGTMLAQQHLSGKSIVCVYEENRYRVTVPEFNDFVKAEAGVEIDALPLSSDITSILRSE